MADRKIEIAIVLLALGLPLLLAGAIWEPHRRQDAKDDQLYDKYDCELERCGGDLTGDGQSDQIYATDFLTYPERSLIVTSNGREILRLPYNYTDGTLRTHTALLTNGAQSRLLIYDGVNYPTPRKAAFGWNGERMVEVPTSEFEREIISAMAAHDDSGGWFNRVIRRLLLQASLAGYYLVLAISITVIVYRRYFLPRTLNAR
jgi:hypothetical protein